MAQLLRFDPAASFLPKTGLEEEDLLGIEYSLGQLRDDVCENVAGAADYLFLPELLLADYLRLRIGSELGRMLAVTKAMMFDVDRVVVVGGGADCLIGRALLHGCCQPYFNELTRGERGSRSRIYFAGDDLDSDALQGLLHLLGAQRHHRSTNVEDSWSVVAIQADPLDTTAQFAFEQFRSALAVSCGEDQQVLDRRLMHIVAAENTTESAVQGAPSESASRAASFRVASQSHRQGTPFSAVGLVPAALMGINVMRLLEGAADINAHFRGVRPAENMVLQYAAINHLLQKQGKARVRIVNAWSPALASAGAWYTRILVTSLGGMTPTNIVSPREPISSLQPTPKSSPVVVHNVMSENCRFDSLPEVLNSLRPEEPLRPLSNLLATTVEKTASQLRTVGSPATNMFLPRVDEYYLGQYFQMMLLATLIESRLLATACA